MNELLVGKRQQWVYGLSIVSGVSFVLKGQIFGNLILDLLTSNPLPSHSKSWGEKLSILSIGNSVSFSCLLFCRSILFSVTIPNDEWTSIYKNDADICSIKKRVFNLFGINHLYDFYWV